MENGTWSRLTSHMNTIALCIKLNSQTIQLSSIEWICIKSENQELSSSIIFHPHLVVINFSVSGDDDSLLNASFGDPSLHRLQKRCDTRWDSSEEELITVWCKHPDTRCWVSFAACARLCVNPIRPSRISSIGDCTVLFGLTAFGQSATN